MKKFLTLCLMLFLSVGTQAQMLNNPARPAVGNDGTPNAGGLFPELGGGGVNRTSGVNRSGATNTTPRPDQLDAGMIRLIINDISIVNPPMNGISFCTGEMTVENQMNVPIRTLNIFAQYGSLSVPIAFSNVAANGGKQEQSVAFAGENCNNLLNVPRITVRECVAGGLNAQGCQQRIKYVPIS